jgi:ABC-2 type transport system ATP-binding protein
MTDFAVETIKLTKSYGALTSVRALDLAVRPGEMFGLVGPDGAGKTTTIRLLCGVIKATSGQGRILGFDLNRDGGRIKDAIGYLSQRFSLYGDLTVDENIEFFAGIHGVKNLPTRRNELLEFTRLTPFRNRLAERLSGGMRQKLALACTLIHTPKVLFLDEPTTGVDPVSRRDFWKILSGLMKTGITIIMTTPYLDEAERCSRIGFMNEGRLVAVDSPRKLKTLMTGVVLEIVCERIRAAYHALMKADPGGDVRLFGDRLNVIVRDGETGLARIRSVLRGEGLAVDAWRIIPPSLENVFISLTQA